jgi:general secretion pathway protein G
MKRANLQVQGGFWAMTLLSSDNRRNERGFTLIELMLVIVILGILAGVAVTNLTGVGEDARKTKAKTDIATIQTSLGMYEVQMGSYPTDDEGIQALVEKTEEHGSFLKTMPIDPWGQPYNYRQESENGMDGPDVWSNGKDKQEGTEDDIGNWQTEGAEDGTSATSGTGPSTKSSSSSSSGSSAPSSSSE